MLFKRFLQLPKTILPKRSFSLKSKVLPSSAQAVKDIKDGNTIAVGGFGICGTPINLINAVHQNGSKDLTIISNNPGTRQIGLGLLFKSRRVKKMIASYTGENKNFQDQYLNGELMVQFTPQGTLAEKLRAGGAGIPAFYTPTSYGTPIQTGDFPLKLKKGGEGVEMYRQKKEVRQFRGRMYVMEQALYPDFALVKAYKADTLGNAIFRKTARNFNPDVGAAGKICIVQAEEIVQPGELDPDNIHLPHIFVNRVVKGEDSHKPIEQLTLSTGGQIQIPGKGEAKKRRQLIVRRAALEIKDGMNVNLGIGMPTIAANFVNKDYTVFLQSQNGLLGIGPFPEKGQQDADLINAGKQTITQMTGSSFFQSSQSFKQIRGGHMDLTILGGLEVSQQGDLANWVVPGKFVKGMGGAMDLVGSGSRVVVTMEHTAKGAPKFLKECSLPLTGKGVVSLLITEMGVFEFDKEKGAKLIEIADGIDVESIKAVTQANFRVCNNLKPMQSS